MGRGMGTCTTKLLMHEFQTSMYAKGLVLQKISYSRVQTARRNWIGGLKETEGGKCEEGKDLPL